MSVIDQAGQVRDGEEINIAAVEQWLKAQGIAVHGTPIVSQYAGGASNWTYRIKYDQYDLILRRPPKGTIAKSAHDMVREYQVQKDLEPYYTAVPKMLALCQDHDVMGCDFYVMQRIEGIIPRAKLPAELLLDQEQITKLCHNVLDKLIELHQIPYQETPLAQLGKGEDYCQRQVDGWDQRYVTAKTLNVPSFTYVRSWLKRNVPSDSTTCIIHNDWRLDNLIFDPQQPTEVIGVLDWEMATLGDPLMDLGSALAYWVQEDDPHIFKSTRRQPTHLKGMLSRKEVVNYYLEKTGLKPQNWLFYEVFGIFRLAVIAQQIYYRYYHKQTDNPAFKDFWIVIHALHLRALRMIAQQKIQANVLVQRYQPKLQRIFDRAGRENK